MKFLFEKPIANAIKEKLGIDINNSEYSKTIFSVDSIETEDSVNFPFDKTYKGDILIFKMINQYMLCSTQSKAVRIYPNSLYAQFI